MNFEGVPKGIGNWMVGIVLVKLRYRMDSNGALFVTSVSTGYLRARNASVTMVSRAFGRLAAACEVAATIDPVEASREVQF